VRIEAAISDIEALGGIEPSETPVAGPFHEVSLAFSW
jgi:hypothetical protein